MNPRSTLSSIYSRSRLYSAQVALALLGAMALQNPSLAQAAEDAHVVPAPLLDETPGSAPASETLVLAGGCFWGVQGVYQHVKGVSKAVSGYAGGDAATAAYETVSGGRTGHAESVQITYDPKQVSYGQLLQIFFSVVHDPTQLNHQGADRGTQYRSTIFAQDEQQKKLASAYIAQLDKAKIFDAPIVTTIETFKGFYPAERYHQDFLTLNPDNPYIAYNDIPKVENLARLFPQDYRKQPVLVLASSGKP